MKFPKQIYVKREYGNGREESWLAAQASPAGIVEADEEETVLADAWNAIPRAEKTQYAAIKDKRKTALEAYQPAGDV